MLVYQPDTPLEKQVQSWTCSIRTTTWLLKSVNKNFLGGQRLDAGDLQDLMFPTLVSREQGLLEGSGAGVARLLRHRFGLDAENRTPITWEWLQANAGARPIGIGGHIWNHWSAVRGTNGDGTIALANPAPGHMGVGQSLSHGQFEALGKPFAAVWINLGEDTAEPVDPTTALEAEIARLNAELAREKSWGSAILADVIKPAYAILGQALAADPLDRARVEQVRKLLGDNGGKD